MARLARGPVSELLASDRKNSPPPLQQSRCPWPLALQARQASAHDSPDGHLPGRDILLAMYIHVAHHRGQAEIYLRDKGIRPPGYRI
jgi:uncharacterized damage-inducible protein DinB